MRLPDHPGDPPGRPGNSAPRDDAGQRQNERVDAAAEPITVVIADDHPVVRNGPRALVDSLPGLTVVGEATDGEAPSARRSCCARTSS